MKIRDVIKSSEHDIKDFQEWVSSVSPVSFSEWASKNCRVAEIFKYASILFPEFLEVEQAIVLKDRFSQEQWEELREELEPTEAANVINFVHIEECFPHDDTPERIKLEKSLGSLLTAFWSMALKAQFPKHDTFITINCDVIQILNRPRKPL